MQRFPPTIQLADLPTRVYTGSSPATDHPEAYTMVRWRVWFCWLPCP